MGPLQDLDDPAFRISSLGLGFDPDYHLVLVHGGVQLGSWNEDVPPPTLRDDEPVPVPGHRQGSDPEIDLIGEGMASSCLDSIDTFNTKNSASEISWPHVKELDVFKPLPGKEGSKTFKALTKYFANRKV